MSNIEIEIQVKIANSAPLLKFLAANGEFVGAKRQLDEYFTPPHRDFCVVRPVAEWLRLRDADGKYSINYKNWHFDADGRSHFCDEYETKVEDIEKMRKIFAALNFKKIVAVDKVRKIWTVVISPSDVIPAKAGILSKEKDSSFRWNDNLTLDSSPRADGNDSESSGRMIWEVAIDSVRNLGDFVEIEYKGDDENAIPNKITAEMVGWLKGLGCGKIDRGYQGYPFVLLFPREAKYKEQ